MIICKTNPQRQLRYLLQALPCTHSNNKRRNRRAFSLVVETPTNIITQSCDVPIHITKPHYAQTDHPQGFLSSLFQSRSKNQANGFVKNEAIVSKIKQACRVGRRVLNHVGQAVRPGVSTDDLDFVAHHLICEEDAYPSPLRYQFFPKSICTSVNNVVVHGIPDSRKLEEGDIINIDISVFLDGVHGDLSETYLVGDVDKEGKKLVEVTKQCLHEAISICGPGQLLQKIGQTISSIAHAHGYTVCPHYVGHGIGEEFHEMPQILHHDNDYPGNMVPGMVFTIEPVLCEGGTDILHWRDGWTVVTKDGKRAAQFEHTIHITDSGFEVLTKDDPSNDFLQPNEVSLKKVESLLTSRTQDHQVNTMFQ